MVKQETSTQNKRFKPKRKRPGIHSKNKTSYSKKSKNWKKKYRGQGR